MVKLSKFTTSLITKTIEIKWDTIFHLANSTELIFRIQLMRVSENYHSYILLIKDKLTSSF